MTSRRFGRITALVMAATMLATLAPLGSPGAARAVTLSAPVLTSPDSGSTVSANPVFAWTAVADAVKYRIEISQSPVFSSTVVADETFNVRYTPIVELPLGDLYWRVAARDASNALGVWETSTFTKEWATAPNPLTPADGATLQFPADPLLFTWTSRSTGRPCRSSKGRRTARSSPMSSSTGTPCPAPSSTRSR
jgi:hypothetical protein